MNGAHDLGGKQGFGAINPEPELEEPLFHAEWERRVFAMTLATGMLGQWNIDESRHARERQHPVDYLRHSYYENGLQGVETLLQEKGLLDIDEAGLQRLTVPDASGAEKNLFSGGPTLMPDVKAPLFGPGDSVRVTRRREPGHTRMPAYVQGAVGRIEAHYGSHVFPDANARGERRGEHLYSVSFSGEQLWGPGAEVARVLVDLWEPYLEVPG
jgi:nitrile hydratase beta subunit